MGEIILEVNETGEEMARGWWNHEDSPKKAASAGAYFYGRDLGMARPDIRFEMLPAIQVLVDESRDRSRTEARGDTDFEVLCHHVEQRLAGKHFQLSVRQALRSGPPLPGAGGIVLHFEWPDGDRPWPKPSARELAERRLFSTPQFFYADGTPVEPGDAVLLGEAGTPAQVMHFRAQTAKEGKAGVVRPRSEFQFEVELKPWVITLEDGTGNVPPVGADRVESGLKLVERSTTDYVRAGLNWIEVNAPRGDAHAQFALANQLISGRHLMQDYERAVHWLREAAQQDHSGAQFQLGQLCFQGLGVTASLEQALVWWQRAAEAGRPEAQYTLGLRHERGEGVPQNYASAVEWYEKAAAQAGMNWNAKAQYQLGLYYEARGSVEDRRSAKAWYQSATQIGHAAARMRLQDAGLAPEPETA